MTRASTKKKTGPKAAARKRGPKDTALTGRSGRVRFPGVRRLAPLVLVAVASLGVLVGLAALPARTWLDQKRTTAETSTELQRVEAEVAELELKLQVLETDDEVERMGRENFDLVYPGEESYRILPAPDED